jgi:orotidine-5'-phosphate decarboxylase
MADIAIALDLPTGEEALGLVDQVGGDATWYKVGSVLAAREGPALLRALIDRGKKVFLDLKWHDIPNTVAGAVLSASSSGVSLATVHLSGGRAMLEAAVAARGAGLRLVGVGVLTSLDEAGYGAVVGRAVTDIGAEQERLMQLGLGLLDGFVTAPGETARVRKFAGAGAFLVTPGIRPAGSAAGDQVRVATPADAVRAGSDLLVIGRPITEARDPAAVVRAIRADIAPAL